MQPNTHFKELRKRLKLSQVELAKQIDVSQGTVTDIERGRIGVSKRVAKRLQEKFGLQLSEIYENNEKIQHFDSDKTIGDQKTGVKWSKTMKEQFLKDLQNDPNWNKAHLINFQLWKENHAALEAFKKELSRYWEINSRMFRFLYQYSILYTSELQKDIYEKLLEGASEQQIIAEFEERINNTESLKGVYKAVNEKLKASIEDLRPYDFHNTMKISKDKETGKSYVSETRFYLPNDPEFWKHFFLHMEL